MLFVINYNNDVAPKHEKIGSCYVTRLGQSCCTEIKEVQHNAHKIKYTENIAHRMAREQRIKNKFCKSCCTENKKWQEHCTILTLSPPLPDM